MCCEQGGTGLLNHCSQCLLWLEEEAGSRSQRQPGRLPAARGGQYGRSHGIRNVMSRYVSQSRMYHGRSTVVWFKITFVTFDTGLKQSESLCVKMEALRFHMRPTERKRLQLWLCAHCWPHTCCCYTYLENQAKTYEEYEAAKRCDVINTPL